MRHSPGTRGKYFPSRKQKGQRPAILYRNSYTAQNLCHRTACQPIACTCRLPPSPRRGPRLAYVQDNVCDPSPRLHTSCARAPLLLMHSPVRRHVGVLACTRCGPREQRSCGPSGAVLELGRHRKILSCNKGGAAWKNPRGCHPMDASQWMPPRKTHSVVAGGFGEISKATRAMPSISLMPLTISCAHASRKQIDANQRSDAYPWR